MSGLFESCTATLHLLMDNRLGLHNNLDRLADFDENLTKREDGVLLVVDDAEDHLGVFFFLFLFFFFLFLFVFCTGTPDRGTNRPVPTQPNRSRPDPTEPNRTRHNPSKPDPMSTSADLCRITHRLGKHNTALNRVE